MYQMWAGSGHYFAVWVTMHLWVFDLWGDPVVSCFLVLEADIHARVPAWYLPVILE